MEHRFRVAVCCLPVIAPLLLVTACGETGISEAYSCTDAGLAQHQVLREEITLAQDQLGLTERPTAVRDCDSSGSALVIASTSLEPEAFLAELGRSFDCDSVEHGDAAGTRTCQTRDVRFTARPIGKDADGEVDFEVVE